MISDSTNDDRGFLEKARRALPIGVPFGSVDEAISLVQIAFVLNDFKPIDVAIIDHAKMLDHSMGAGDQSPSPVGQYIAYNDPRSAIDVGRFILGLGGIVDSVWFLGCKFAASPRGPLFMQELATGLGAPVSAYTGETYFSNIGFYVEQNATLVTVNP